MAMLKDFFYFLTYLSPILGLILVLVIWCSIRTDQDLIGVSQSVRENGKPILIEFSSDRCSICQHVTPMVRKLYYQQYFKKANFVLVDTDDARNTELLRRFHIHSVPAIFVLSPILGRIQDTRYRVQLHVQNHADESSMKHALDNAFKLI